MKKYLILCLLMIPSLTLAQRGKTGDKTFKDRFPPEVFNEVSNASLVLINEVDHDIIVSVRDQKKSFSDTSIFAIMINTFLSNFQSHDSMCNLSQKIFIMKIASARISITAKNTLLIFSLMPPKWAIIIK